MESQKTEETVAFHTGTNGPCRLTGGFNEIPALLIRQAGKMPRYGRLHIATILVILTALVLSTLLLANMLKSAPWPDKDLLARFVEHSGSGPISVTNVGRTVWTKSYDVSFAPAEQMLVVAELYEADKPMRLLGKGILAGSAKEQRLTVAFTRTYKNEPGASVGHSATIHLNGLVLKIPEFTVNKQSSQSNDVINWSQGCELRKLSRGSFTTLLSYGTVDTDANKQIWVPGLGVSTGIHSRFVLKMIPVSRLKYLALAPIGGSQGLDGHIIPNDLTDEQLNVIGEQYKQSMTAQVVKLAGGGE